MQTTELRATIEQAKDAITVRRVFGDPYEKDGVTVIPAARVQGGAGGGTGEGPQGEGGSGSGSGFGVNARPVGAFVIRGEEVEWRPAIDVNKVILGGQLVAIAALLLIRAVVRSREAVLRRQTGIGGGGGGTIGEPGIAVAAAGRRYVALPKLRIIRKIQDRKISPRVNPTPLPKLFDRSL